MCSTGLSLCPHDAWGRGWPKRDGASRASCPSSPTSSWSRRCCSMLGQLPGARAAASIGADRGAQRFRARRSGAARLRGLVRVEPAPLSGVRGPGTQAGPDRSGVPRVPAQRPDDDWGRGRTCGRGATDGASNASLRVEFVTKSDVLPELVGKELILVTTRNGAYFVVEREPPRPSQQPTSYVVPMTAVDAARVHPFNADAAE